MNTQYADLMQEIRKLAEGQRQTNALLTVLGMIAITQLGPGNAQDELAKLLDKVAKKGK